MLINRQHTEFTLPYDPRPATADDVLLVFSGSDVLLREAADTGSLPLHGEAAGAAEGSKPLHAFTQGKRRFFIASAAPEAPAPPGLVFENIRVFRNMQPEEDGFLLATAYHLSVWYGQHRYCGVCGGPMHPAPQERALVCRDCGITIYPSVLPAVIVAVTHNDKLLLARNAHGPWRRFSLLAGYVEVGESAEQAVQREVAEEAGITLKNIRYLQSQPWGLSQSLMLGFSAELDGADTITLQESELAEARWFTRDEVPQYDSTASISVALIEMFRSGLIGGQE